MAQARFLASDRRCRGRNLAAPVAAAQVLGQRSGSSSGSAAGKAFNACMVLDTGGVDDRSFNQSS